MTTCNPKAEAFLTSLKGKTVVVCGIGHNNVPVVWQLLQYGANVIACDRRTREQLGETADQLAAAGVELRLGEHYLDDLAGDLILRTPGMKPYLPQFEEARRRGLTVTSEMELFFDLCPAPIYAITGSDGKTTTTSIIAGLLEKAGKTVHLGGNIGRPLLPDILHIQSDHMVVVELSSFQLTGMTQSPRVAVVTNLAPNHLDWHTDMQEYIDAKRNIVAHQQPGDRAVLNWDNEITAGFAEGLKSTVFAFSRLREVPNGAFLGGDGMLYAAQNGERAPVLPAREIKLPGNHNIENYLAAIAAVMDVVPAEVIAAFAREFGGVPHRCELVRELHGVRWYNDSIGTSPSRTNAGLLSFDRKVILIAGGYDKHIPYDSLGKVAARTVKAAILMGPTGPAIQRAIQAADSRIPCIPVSGMEEAVKTAHALAKEGDIVFMSPASASFDRYKNFEERGNHFKDLVNAL